MRKVFFIIIFILNGMGLYSQKVLQVDSFKEFSEGFAGVRKGEYWAFIDTIGNFVTDFNIPHMKFYNLQVVDSVYITWIYSCGYTNIKNQNIILEPKYDLIPFSEGIGIYVDKDFIDLDNTGFVSRGSDKKFTVRFIDNKGVEIFNKNVICGFESQIKLRPFVNGFCVLKSKGITYILIDKKGNELCSLNCLEAGNFSDGLIKVKNLNQYGETKWGFIDRNGKLVIDYKFTYEPTDFKDGIAAVKGKNNKYGFINKAGEVIIDFKYREVFSFKENKCIVRLDYDDYDSKNSKGYALIDKNGNILRRYADIEITSDVIDNMIRFEKHYDEIGYMNLEGEVLIPPIFSKLSLFNSERAFASLEKDNKFIEGFINKDGDFVIIKGEDVPY
jgi:hypothetical protein